MPMSSRRDAGVTKRGVRGEEATRAAIANVVTAKSDVPSECQRLPASTSSCTSSRVAHAQSIERRDIFMRRKTKGECLRVRNHE